MAIRLNVNITKKVPIPGLDYSSQTASCSIEAECSTADPVAEAAALYLQAEAAVDRQLRLGSEPRPVTRPASTRSTPSDHHPRRGRRTPPPITASQLRLLQRLVDAQPDRLPPALRHYQAERLADLDIGQASELIDSLKTEGVGR